MHDVFISYSTIDTAIANAVCHGLEARKIRCWMAPRDMPPGWTWKESLVRVVPKSPVVVLILSPNSNASPPVNREVDIAFNNGVPIIPFHVERVTKDALTETLVFSIDHVHWLDALTPPVEQYIQQLADGVQAFLPSRRKAMGLTEPSPNGEAATSRGAATTNDVAVDQSTTGRSDTPSTFSNSTTSPSKPVRPTPSVSDTVPAVPRKKGLSPVAIGGIVAVLVVGIGVVYVVRANGNAQGIQAFDGGRYTEARPLLEQAANHGDAASQERLGEIFERGLTGDTSYSDAIRWYDAAAAKGNAAARTAVARLANGWTTTPIVPGAWENVTGDERQTELAKVDTARFFANLHPIAAQRLRKLAAPFMPGAVLYELEVGSRTHFVIEGSLHDVDKYSANPKVATITYVRIGDRRIYIDGSPTAMQQLRKAGAVLIDDAVAASAWSHLTLGGMQNPADPTSTPFRVINTAADLHANRESGAVPATVASRITHFVISRENDNWGFDSTVQLSNGLFQIHMVVTKAGDTQMSAPKVIAESLPIQVTRFVNGLRMEVPSN